MIRITDAAVLAVTKLRTRKVRTIVTVVTASLLFGILVFAIFVSGGVLGSAKNFTTGGLSDRYIVRAQYFDSLSVPDSPDIKARATEIYNKLVADKKAEAKRLGIEYDPTSEIKPLQPGGPEGTTFLDMSSPSAQQAIDEYRLTQPTLRERVEKVAKPYHPVRYYDLAPAKIDGMIALMKDGKEKFTDEQKNNSYTMQPDIDAGWFYLDRSITKSFLLDKKYLDAQKNITDMPVIAPYSKVQAALGLKPLPKNATQNEQLERIKYLRAHAAEATFTVCQRNAVSKSQIDEAIRLNKELERNKNNKEYQAPSLQYGLPDESSCGPAVIKKDTRSSTEKQMIDKQRQFEKTFGAEVEPVQRKLTFRVVGLAPDAPDFNNFSTVDGIMSMIAADSLQGMWIVPSDLYEQLPNKADYAAFYPDGMTKTANLFSSFSFSQMPSQLVEFSNTADAKSFNEKEACMMNCGQGKPSLMYFGSNSVLIEQITDMVVKTLGVAAAIVAAIAALIMMGMVGRVIGDSRRETAVFRAIGAKRNDIRAIYTIYTVLLSAFIALSSLVIGAIGALWVDRTYSNYATVKAQLMYVGADSGTQFHLIGFWWEALLVVVGLVIAAGLISMLLPLARNLARNPIRDMRDE